MKLAALLQVVLMLPLISGKRGIEYCDTKFERGLSYETLSLERSELCPMEKAVFSVDSGQSTRFMMHNNGTSPAHLFFVGHSGEEEFVDTVPAKQSYELDTFQGHVFHLRRPAPEGQVGLLLGRHRVGLVAFYNRHNYPCDEHTQNLPDWTPMPPREDPDKLECGFIRQGFVNKSPCQLEVFFVRESTNDNKLVAQLGTKTSHPGKEYDEVFGSAYHYEFTYDEHTFVAKSRSGKIFDTHTMGPFVFQECPERAQTGTFEFKEDKDGARAAQALNSTVSASAQSVALKAPLGTLVNDTKADGHASYRPVSLGVKAAAVQCS